MHAETLRGVSREKLPFAEYSGVSLFDKIVWDDSTFALGDACEWRREGRDPRQLRLPVVIGSGSHPFPFRTRKLSLIPPMVLHGKLCGRVGRCRQYSSEPASSGSRACVCTAAAATQVSDAAWASLL